MEPQLACVILPVLARHCTLAALLRCCFASTTPCHTIKLQWQAAGASPHPVAVSSELGELPGNALRVAPRRQLHFRRVPRKILVLAKHLRQVARRCGH